MFICPVHSRFSALGMTHLPTPPQQPVLRLLIRGLHFRRVAISPATSYSSGQQRNGGDNRKERCGAAPELPTSAPSVSFPPIADIRVSADNCLVSRRSVLDELSKRAPTIVAFTLFAALVADWINAPVVLPQGLAIIVGSLALALLAARGRRQVSAKDLGFDSDIGWIAYELADKGTPQGFYVLGFFGVLTIVLTGVQSPYSLPAWAAFALHIAWGMANARYPLDDE